MLITNSVPEVTLTAMVVSNHLKYRDIDLSYTQPQRYRAALTFMTK